MSKHDELMALLEEIKNSDALIYERRILAIQTIYYVFHRNYEELHRVIEFSKQKKAHNLWDLRNRPQLDKVIVEIMRLLQAYVASAKATVDQVRILIRKWYKDTDFLRDNQSQIDSRFSNNSLSLFIEDLRNYNLHYSLPVTRATFSLTLNDDTKKHTADFTFALRKSGLLEWEKWDKGKAFLLEANDDIDIGYLTEEYHKQVEDYRSWLINRLKEMHKEDLDWLQEIKQQARSKLSDKELKARGWI